MVLSNQVMGIIAGTGLLILVIGSLGVVLLPTKQRDPAHGMAVGCLMICVAGGLGLGGLLAIGLAWEVNWLVRVIFWGVATPMAILMVNLLALLARRAKCRRG